MMMIRGFTDHFERLKEFCTWAVVDTELEERSLPTPEARGSNPAIGEIL